MVKVVEVYSCHEHSLPDGRWYPGFQAPLSWVFGWLGWPGCSTSQLGAFCKQKLEERLGTYGRNNTFTEETFMRQRTSGHHNLRHFKGDQIPKTFMKQRTTNSNIQQRIKNLKLWLNWKTAHSKIQRRTTHLKHSLNRGKKTLSSKRKPQTQMSKREPLTSGADCAQRGGKLAQGTRLGATHWCGEYFHFSASFSVSFIIQIYCTLKLVVLEESQLMLSWVNIGWLFFSVWPNFTSFYQPTVKHKTIVFGTSHHH